MKLPIVRVKDTCINFNNVISWLWEDDKTLMIKYVTGHSERFHFYSVISAKEFTQSVRKITKDRNMI